MKRSRFTQEQIIAILKEGEAGAKPAGFCQRCGISEVTYFSWKSKCGGMEVKRGEADKRGFRSARVVLWERWKTGVAA